MEDYTANSNKSKAKATKPPKDIKKVVQNEVIIQKKSLGRKFKDLFVEADFRSVARYIFSDVLLPAARNTVVDASTKGIERMMYGERSNRSRGSGSGPRITYNSPVSRGYRDMSSSPGRVPGENRTPPRHTPGDFILSTREEAELVLERMNDIIETYDIVSVGDLNDLVGLPTSYTDNKWGWIDLVNVQVRQIREGYLIDLPSPEPIQ